MAAAFEGRRRWALALALLAIGTALNAAMAFAAPAGVRVQLIAVIPACIVACAVASRSPMFSLLAAVVFYAASESDLLVRDPRFIVPYMGYARFWWRLGATAALGLAAGLAAWVASGEAKRYRAATAGNVIHTDVYFYVFLVLGLAVTAFVTSAVIGHFLEEPWVGGAIRLAAGAEAAALAVVLVFLYRVWSMLPREAARTTAARAVGFLFIPLFNLYWIFQAFRGFARDFNRLVRARGLGVKPISQGAATAVGAMALAALVPPAAPAAGLVGFVLVLVFMRQAGDGVNALAAALQSARAEAPDIPAAGPASPPG